MVKPRERSSWDDVFGAIATAIAQRSPDPSSQVGAVVVTAEHEVLGLGFNGPSRAFNDATFDWARPAKYDGVVHAEANALYFALRHHRAWLDGCTLYTTSRICSRCALLATHFRLAIVVCGAQRPRVCDAEDWALTKLTLRRGRVRLRGGA